MSQQRYILWLGLLLLPMLSACQCSVPAQAPLPWSGPGCFAPPPFCTSKLICQSGLWKCISCIDGETKICYTGPAKTVGIGTCKEGAQQCILGAWSVCTDQVKPNLKEKCGDKVDDNCNGEVDEDCQCTPGSVPQVCGQTIGLCLAGQQTCSPEGIWLACVGEKKPQQDVCDNEDNDCDGQVDEDFKPKALGPRGLGEACTAGLGACKSAGTYICGPKRISTVCDAVAKKESTEICDGIDNDCDGKTDEDFQVASIGARGLKEKCDVGEGACKGVGEYKCSSDKKKTVCTAQKGKSDIEKCDNIDNNCDGNIDETFPEKGKSCDVKDQKGVCKQGKYVCSKGKLTCPQSNNSAQETCNGADDDCNGKIDDGLTAPPCAKTKGVCKDKKQRCDGKNGWLPCTDADYGSLYEANESSCDKEDNDCDGQVDNNLTRACSGGGCGQQTCDGDGKWEGDCSCCSDGDTQSCTPPNPTACNKAEQTCSNKKWGACLPVCCQDGSKRDCYTHRDRSKIDEGECKEGKQECVNGTWSSDCKGEVTPKDEKCNDGKDNDCDGKTDENPGCR